MTDYPADAYQAACAESRRLKSENERLRGQVARVEALCERRRHAGALLLIDLEAALAEPEGGE